MKKIFTESKGKYSEKTAVALENINKFIESLEREVLNDNENFYMLGNK